MKTCIVELFSYVMSAVLEFQCFSLRQSDIYRTLCLLTVTTSVILFVLYGLKFGQARSNLSFSAMLAAVLFSILVVQPLKVIIFAVIHALLLQVVYCAILNRLLYVTNKLFEIYLLSNFFSATNMVLAYCSSL